MIHLRWFPVMDFSDTVGNIELLGRVFPFMFCHAAGIIPLRMPAAEKKTKRNDDNPHQNISLLTVNGI